MKEVTVEKVKVSLVQGTVTFTVSCNDLMGLVSSEVAEDEGYLEEWLEENAFDIIDSADVETEIDNVVEVEIPKEIADKYRGQLIGRTVWKEIISAHKNKEGDQS